MTTFKKIDWLRQLYHEGTKWKLSLAGQVKWRELEVKDPNNGSKFTVMDLETRLPNILNHCLENGLIPSEYLPEVHRCLAYIKKDEKCDCKAIAKLVQARKDALCLFGMLGSFENLTEEEKASVIGKIEDHLLHDLYSVVQKLRMRLKGVVATEGEGDWTNEEKAKAFKLIDWLRHMYLMCQKWLNKKHGQVQWKELNAKDPNNSKQGSRMKLDELKESLKVLAPKCLELEIVPKPYLRELTEMKRILSTQGLNFNPKVLEEEENLRKVASKIVDTFNHDDKFEEVQTIMEPPKLLKMCRVVGDLEVKLGAHLGLTAEVAEVIEAEEVNPDEAGEVLDMFSDEQQDILEEEPMNLLPPLNNEAPADDGTDILLEIMEQASANQTAHSSVSSDVPLSPSSGSEIFSEVSSPASPDRRSIDDHFSDDSGVFSPTSNPLEIEDAEKLEDSEIWDISVDLDFSELPDVRPYLSDSDEDFLMNFEPPNRKRKLSDEGFDEPLSKRAKP